MNKRQYAAAIYKCASPRTTPAVKAALQGEMEKYEAAHETAAHQVLNGFAEGSRPRNRKYSSKALAAAIRQLQRSDALLNDRREYDVDDLQKMYGLTNAEAVALLGWIEERIHGRV